MRLAVVVAAVGVVVAGGAVGAVAATSGATSVSCTRATSGASYTVTCPEPVRTVTATKTVTVTAPPTTAPPTSQPPTTTVPTPTPPTPTPTPAPSDTPPQAGVPAGTTLTAMSGTTITTDGTVIDSRRINGTVHIAARNVTIRNSLLTGTGSYGLLVDSGSVTLTDSTVTGYDFGVAGDNYTATRVEVTGMRDDGFKLGNNVTLDSVWCHDMNPAAGNHIDCGQIQNGVSNVLVQNSWLDGSNATVHMNSALFIAPDLGPSAAGPVVIRDNLLGGGNYTLYCVDGNNGQYFIKNITVTGNRFLRDSQYGPVDVNVPVTWSGNVFDDNGAAVGS